MDTRWNGFLADLLAKFNQEEIERGVDQTNCTEIFFPTNTIHAVAVVMHGLNQKPSLMNDVAREMALRGVLCIRGVFSGHGGDAQALASVTRDVWVADVCRVAQFGSTVAKHFGVPLVAVGFSLGGLLVVDAAANAQNPPRFQRAVLLAPAFTPSFWASCLRMTRYFPRFPVPSFSPLAYRANNVLPGCAYSALFASAERVECLAKSPFPAVVYINPRDEIVSFSSIKKFIHKKQGVLGWPVKSVLRSPEVRGGYRHFLFSRSDMGEHVWRGMLRDAVDFLLQTG